MKISNALDNYARRSLISKYIPYLRKYSPRLYMAFKMLWEKSLPINSQNNLARYQVRAIDNFISRTNLNIEGSAILEIGSDSDGKILRELASRGAVRVVGINPGLENESSGMERFQGKGLPKNCELRNDDASALGFDNETFSHIFSVSVFEHLNDFDKCVSEMHRVLKPGGHVYADFGPIWSSSIGHHVYAVSDGEEVRHWNPQKNPVPNFAHLLLGRSEMHDLLRDKVSDGLLNAILKWIYDQSFINRMFYEDYIRILEESPFDIVHLSVDEEHLDQKTKDALCNKYPGYSRFEVRNAEILLRKNANDSL